MCARQIHRCCPYEGTLNLDHYRLCPDILNDNVNLEPLYEVVVILPLKQLFAFSLSFSAFLSPSAIFSLLLPLADVAVSFAINSTVAKCARCGSMVANYTFPLSPDLGSVFNRSTEAWTVCGSRVVLIWKKEKRKQPLTLGFNRNKQNSLNFK